MLQVFGWNKIQTLLETIKSHGGFKNAILVLNRTDDLRLGKLVGTDKFGNKYYENKNHFFGRNRWVVYSDRFGYDFDASQVTPEWYGWLHYKTDLLPYEDGITYSTWYPKLPDLLSNGDPFPNGMDKTRPKYKWMAEPTENLTGTSLQYVPYTTTKPKIQAWVPSNLKK